MEKFNLHRRDSGWLRLLIVLVFATVSAVFLWAGYKLVLSGIAGSWKIVSSFKGFTLYITSICPGLLVIIVAGLILIWGLPKTLKTL